MEIVDKFRALHDLKMIRKVVMEDNRIDINESNFLLNYIRPLANRKNFHIRYFEELLRRANVNGKISEIESSEIAEALDNTIYFMRVEAWFPILITSFIIALAIAIIF